MQYLITHKTNYDYGDLVPECFNIVRLAPRKVANQVTVSHELTIDPEPSSRTVRTDYFGNSAEYFAIAVPHSKLVVTSKSLIERQAPAIPDAKASPAWEKLAEHAFSSDLIVAQLRFPSRHIALDESFREYTKESFDGGRPIVEATIELTERIFQDFEFDPKATTVSTPVEEVFEKKAGVCQDFAHFQIACLRSIGIPARYVSGYLRTKPPEGKPRLIGADASHAWVSVFCGDAGWVDFDPTNDVMPELDHITIAWGRDYSDVCPIQGVYTGGGTSTLSVEVDVVPETEF